MNPSRGRLTAVVNHPAMLGLCLAVAMSLGQLTLPSANLALKAHQKDEHIIFIEVFGMSAQLLGAFLCAPLFATIGAKKMILRFRLLSLIASAFLIVGVMTFFVPYFYLSRIMGAVAGAVSITAGQLIFRKSMEEKQHKGQGAMTIFRSGLYAAFYWLGFHFFSFLQWSVVALLIAILLLVFYFFVNEPEGTVAEKKKTVQRSFNFDLKNMGTQWKRTWVKTKMVWKDESFKFAMRNFGPQMAMGQTFALLLPLAIGIAASSVVSIVTFVGGLVLFLLTNSMDLDTRRSHWVNPIISVSRFSLLLGFLLLGAKAIWFHENIWLYLATGFLVVGYVNNSLFSTKIFNRSKNSHIGVSVDNVVFNLTGVSGVLFGLGIGYFFGYGVAILAFVPLIGLSFVQSLRRE